MAAIALLFALLGCGSEERGGPTPMEGKITATEQKDAAPAKDDDQFKRYNAGN